MAGVSREAPAILFPVDPPVVRFRFLRYDRFRFAQVMMSPTPALRFQ
jgi:hypothetical protein